MSSHIDPLILQKLDAFSRRRRKLIMMRGVCAAVATLLLAMMVVALIDAIFVLPDTVRWGLSAAAYLAVVVVEWRASLRLLLHAPGTRRLARLFEHAEPKLREDLLSAVELGEARGSDVCDSEQFRALVQSDVAHRMEGMDIERLLPVNLVRRYIGLGIVAAVVCVAAFVLSGLQFGTLMLRALAPGANLARVSRVQVRIVAPESPDKVVAQGETEPLVIAISGQRVNAARLETTTASGREVLKMTPLGPDRFSATIQVGREDVAYRVFAGDAVTKRFRLRAVARPHVVKFEKTFTYPAYSRLAPRRVTEENGDLVALEGSEAELRLETNQKVRDAELRIEQGQKNTIVKLVSEGGRLTAKVPLTASGTYRVHLVGADTGFENKFSPEYELRAEPDLVPQVELESPKQDLILPANEIVDVQGTASDDLALAKVVQLVKINDGKWNEVPLATDPGPKVTVQRRWDLFEQGVKAGDLVTMKLAAVDLKGGRAESKPVQVTITQSGFESKRLAALEAARQLYETLKTLRTSAEALEKRSRDARDQFEKLGEGDEQRKAVVVGAGDGLAEIEQKINDAWTQLEATLKGAEAGHAGADLVQLGRLISRLNLGAAQMAKDAIEAAAADPIQPWARDLVHDFADGCSRASQRARLAEEWYRGLLFSEEFEVICENVEVVAAEQRRLADLAGKTSKDASQWTQVAGRERVIFSEIRSIEGLIDASVPHGQGDRLKQVRKRLEDERGKMDKALGAGEPGAPLLAPILNARRTLEEVSRFALENHRDQLFNAARMHMDLGRENQPTYATFEKLRQDLAQVTSRSQWPSAVRTRLADRRWDERGQLVKQHGDLEEARAASDTYFVNDVRLATLALDALHQAAPTAGFEKTNLQLVNLDKSFRLLETGHDVAGALDGLLHLAAAERWEIATVRSRTTNPRDWRWLDAQLRVLPDELVRMQPDPALRQTVQDAQKILSGAQRLPAWQNVEREMRDRFNPQREPAASVADVEQIAVPVKQALDLLRKPMDEARKLLVALAPKLHEMMAELAKKTEELKQKTEEQAHQAAEQPAEKVQAGAQEALAEQQKINERVESLKDALRADANKQDILDPNGRERARDADDALAMLKEPPPKAEQALSEATQAAQSAEKAEALKEAAQEQQKLASALDQLAKHYENAESGKAGETRTALRATEEQTGIKEAMDRQFARAQELAQMASESPEELLKKLEKALPPNPTMQQELSSITKNALDAAAGKLAEANAREAEVARDVQKIAAEQQAQMAANVPAAAPSNAAAAPQPAQNQPIQPPAGSKQPAPSPAPPQTAKAPETVASNVPAPPNSPPPPTVGNPAEIPPHPALAQAAQQQPPIAQSANAAGDDIARAGRHEQRLQNTQPGEKLESLGNQVKDTAANEVPKAGQALAQAQQAAQAEGAVNAAKNQLERELGELQAAAGAPSSPKPAAQPQGKAENQNPPAPAGQTAAAPGAPGQPAMASPSTAAASAPNAGQPTAKSSPPATPGTPDSASPFPAVPSGMPQLPAEFGQLPTGPATPQEQVWMARTLDALDAALHSEPSAAANAQGSETAQAAQGQPQQAGQSQKGGQQPGGKDLAQAKQAMNSAAQAAAAAMRASRSPAKSENPGGPLDEGPEQAVSRSGAQAQADAKAYGKLAAGKGKPGDWGKLPKQVAEQLTRGQNENIAGEYRNQIETYYRVIAEKSKKP